MKKINIFYSLLMTAVFLLPWSGVRGEELTVADGTATNEYVPVWGNWCDAELHNQLIYPSSLLEAMTGQNITKMTFYLSSSASGKWTSTFTIGLAEVPESSISGSGGYWATYYHKMVQVQL